jgi:nitrogen fixation protein NifB
MSFENHPCFSADARHKVGRIHLPVAPKCNVQCNFCNRSFDCVNESRPGVTSSLLSPVQAADYLETVREKIDSIEVVGIAGPGDPFANAFETLETFRLVHEKFPNLHLCVATNGLELSKYVDRLASLNVGHVTVTVNAVDPEIGANIYAWIRSGTTIYRGINGAKFLLERQIEGIKKLKEKGITVKINSVVIPGVNDHHVGEIAKFVSELGADIHNCIPMCHVQGTVFESIDPPSNEMIAEIRKTAGGFLPQMSHCQRCRADAAGLLGAQNGTEVAEMLRDAARPKASVNRPHVAVASMEGIFVNQHLGEAAALWIYELKNGGVELIDRRSTPPSGTGAERWRLLAESINDCCAVLSSGVGESPKAFLENAGIRVLAIEGLAREAVESILRGKDIPKILMRTAGKCGAGKSCGGTGMGCA